jgi:hypothetical protein
MDKVDFINIGVASLSAVVVVIILLQVVHIQSKLSKSDITPYYSGSDNTSIPFGVYAVYVDDVKTTALNKSKYILPSVSVTYYTTTTGDSTSIPITSSYTPTNYYLLGLRDTKSAQAFKMMLKTNNANYVVVNKALYGVMLYKDNIVLYTPIRTSAKDILNIVSFAGASTDTTFNVLKTLTSSIPVHILAYKV